MNNVTQILGELNEGNPAAADKLFELVYEELRQIAQAKMLSERKDHTLSSTALVHEAYVRLIGSNDEPSWENRGHFFGAASQAMRRILVEHARRRSRIKRGGDRDRLVVDVADLEMKPESSLDDDQLLALDEALKQLAELDPLKAQLVVLRYFGGMSIEQACSVLGISRTTAHRYWTYAKAWLFRQMSAPPE